MIRFIFGFIPVLVIFSDKLLPERFTAFCWWLIIVVRPKEKNNVGIIEHELMHSRQIWKYLLIPYLILYYGSKKWRLKFEIEAYLIERKHSNITVRKIIDQLYSDYNLDINRDEITTEFTRMM